MPSKKKSTRLAQPQPQASDYDTDTANVTESAPAMAPPPVRTNTELNLTVLRRYVPDIERIISIAPFAVVYVFTPETQQWEKSGVEGTLFVCQLSAAQTGYPRYNVVILNRKSLDNFMTELYSGEDIEITEQYVILQVLSDDGTPSIYGLWIFSDEETSPTTREIVASAIQECAVRAEYSRSATESEEQNGDSNAHTYGLDDGSASLNELHTEHQEQPAPLQSIDVMSLFGNAGEKPPANHNPAMDPYQSQQYEPQSARFISTADTDFFRTSHSPAAAAQTQAQPPPQQNALLNLFKSAQNG